MRKLTLLLVCLFLTLNLGLAQEEATFGYDDKGRRNPFLPLVDKSGRYLLSAEVEYSSEELSLSGILWDPQGKSSALINNQVVKVGEAICGFTIKTITRDSVTILKENREHILRLSIEEEETK